MRKILALTFSFWILAGCTTARISIYSSPENAKVYAKEIGKSKMTLVGETPLFIDNYKVHPESGAGPIYFEIVKDGYKKDSFYITEVSKVDISISRELEPERDFREQAFLNDIVDRLFEVRRLVEAKKLDEALRVLRKLRVEAPQVASIYEMQGGIYLLKQNYKEALSSYKQAYRYNPSNPESLRMVRYIERTFGFAPEYDLINAPEGTRIPATEANPAPVPDNAPTTETNEGDE